MRRIWRVIFRIKAECPCATRRAEREHSFFPPVPTRRPIVLMPHFSSVYSLGFISLIFSLSRPVWLLLYDIENLCKCLILRHVFQTAVRTWKASLGRRQLIYMLGSGHYSHKSWWKSKKSHFFCPLLTAGFLADKIVLSPRAPAWHRMRKLGSWEVKWFLERMERSS